MADLDYKKENMKELHAPDKKVKTGVYVIAALLVLVYLLPIYVMLNQSFRFMTDLSPRLYLPENGHWIIISKHFKMQISGKV